MKAKRRYVMALCGWYVALAGCAGESGSDSMADPQAAGESAQTPLAVAELTVGKNKISVYDFGERALVVETAPAYTPPLLGPMTNAVPDDLLKTWQGLAPGVKLPAALVSLRDRLNQPTRTVDRTTVKLPAPVVSGGQPMDVVPFVSDEYVAAPSGCNNGCCDLQWLSTLWWCSPGSGWNFQWFDYNYGYSYTNTYGVTGEYGMVCSASGVSQWSISLPGHSGGGSWPVQEGYYSSYRWIAGCYFLDCPDTSNIYMTVNSSTNQHLHTFCGEEQ